MGLEIERKFLVKDVDRDLYTGDKVSGNRIKQGYLNLNIYRTVRVRVSSNPLTAFLTVKGKNNGSVRAEFEYEIPLEDGLEMLEMCEDRTVDKVRFKVICNMRDYGPPLIIEVDEFHDKNHGLVVAEIEFAENDPRKDLDSDELLELLDLDWLGAEVTDEPKYYNSSLINNPYTDWGKPT